VLIAIGKRHAAERIGSPGAVVVTYARAASLSQPSPETCPMNLVAVPPERECDRCGKQQPREAASCEKCEIALCEACADDHDSLCGFCEHRACLSPTPSGR